MRTIKKRGQIWVETVIYTLMGIIIIGLALAFIQPKIEEIQDRGIIEQSINTLNYIDEKFSEMKIPGNKRTIDLEIKKGNFYIEGSLDQLIFEIETPYSYSQAGENIQLENGVIALTEKRGDEFVVTLSKNYSSQYDITYRGNDELKTLARAAVPYKFTITNKGGTTTNFDFDVI